MATLGELVLTVSATTADFAASLSKNEQRAKQFADTANTSLSMPFLGAAAAAPGGRISVTSFVGSIRESLSEVDRLGKTARNLGVSVEQLAGLEHAAKLSGVSFEGLASGLERLQHRMGSSADTIEGSTNEDGAALQALGLNVAALQKQNPADQFLSIADSISKLPSAGSRLQGPPEGGDEQRKGQKTC